MKTQNIFFDSKILSFAFSKSQTFSGLPTTTRTLSYFDSLILNYKIFFGKAFLSEKPNIDL